MCEFDSHAKRSAIYISPQRTGTELIRFNIVNIMVVGALAPCVASIHDVDYVE